MVKFCQNCGSEIGDGAVFCEYCGTQQATKQNTQAVPAPPPNIIVNVTNVASAGAGGIQQSPKSRVVALIIWFFLGIIGGHYFYAGRIGMGLLYLCTAGFFGIGWFIDLFTIIFGSFKDSFGRPMK